MFVIQFVYVRYVLIFFLFDLFSVTLLQKYMFVNVEAICIYLNGIITPTVILFYPCRVFLYIPYHSLVKFTFKIKRNAPGIFINIYVVKLKCL